MVRPSYLLLIYMVLAVLLTGCASESSAALEATPPPNIDWSAAPDLQFPEASPTPLPTSIATAVVNVTPTATKTPTPTRLPTATPTLIPATRVLQAQPNTQPQAPPPLVIKHVVIISIDGLRPDALELANTPHLNALRAAGAYSANAQTVLPPVTLVAHSSMLSGMEPEKHGVTWNVDRPLFGSHGELQGPTLFTVAKNAGLKSVMVVGKSKLDQIVTQNAVDNFFYPGFADLPVANQSLSVIQAGLPDILFIHLPDVDTAGHLTGWMSANQMEAITEADGFIGQIVAALDAGGYLNQTLLLITSDHGGNGLTHGQDTPLDRTIPWLAVGPGVQAGLSLKSNIAVYDTAATALYALQLPIPAEWDGRPVLEIFGK